MIRLILTLLFAALISKTALAQSEWDNGYTEAQFNSVLNVFYQVYTPIVEAQGGVFEIDADWSDGTVNAFAWRERNIYRVEVPGGLARYSLMTEDAYIAMICHEIGHLLGGEPLSGQISFEGQSDYYSTNVCMKMMMPLIPLNSPESTNEVKALCQSDRTCERSLMAALAIGRFDAKIAHVEAPRLSTPDTSRVSKTLQSHPEPQCRLDTRKAGALDEPRPACWFNANSN